jgi:hypothetical protein
VITALTEVEVVETPTVELWDAWVFAEIDAEFALKRWWDAAGSERTNAFASYCAALDREASAAAALEFRLTVSGAVAGSS